MQRFQRPTAILGLLGLLVAGASLVPLSAADDGGAYAKLLAEKTPPLVTIKYVLKMKSRFGDDESERETTGLLISADGWVLCSDTSLGGGRWLRRAGGTSTPTDIKILVGDDIEGRDATLVARDSELDLVWMRIEEPGAEPFPFLDLTQATTPKVGDRLYMVARLGRYFDRTPVIRADRIGGIASKPRTLYVPSEGAGALGLPVFAADGELIGIVVSQMPDPEEMDAGGGGDFGAALILPAAKVDEATGRAKQVAASDEDDEAAEEKPED
jgi:hypothetical protein